jgi:membrane protease YdiL (CAAX protease family)
MSRKKLTQITDLFSVPAKPTIGFVFGACALLSTVLLLIWYAIPDSVLTFSKTSLIGYSIISVCRLLICLLFPFVFIVSRYKIPEKRLFGMNPGIGALIISLLAGFPAMLLFVSIHNLTSRFLLLNNIFPPPPAIFFATSDQSTEAILLTLIVGALLPILLQELYFRGLLFSSLPGQLTGFRGNVWIALLFAIYMLNPVDFFGYFLLGLLLGYIRSSTDNLFCPMLTQVSMIGCVYAFRSLLPYLNTLEIRSHIDIDPTLLYISVTSIIMGSLCLFPILNQFRRIADFLRMEKIDEPPKEPSPIREHIGWSFWLGLLFFAGIWVLTIGI